MSGLDVVAGGCYLLGVVVVVLSAALALPLPHTEDRLHLLAPMTSLGTPLVALGLALRNGWSLTTLQIVLTCLLICVTGPVMTSAAARVAAMQKGAIPRETPQ